MVSSPGRLFNARFRIGGDFFSTGWRAALIAVL